MESIFDALDGLLDIITLFLYDKAFARNKNTIKRLPYIIMYTLLLMLIIAILIYLGLCLINNNNIFGYVLLLLSLLLLVILIYPFIKINKFKRK